VRPAFHDRVRRFVAPAFPRGAAARTMRSIDPRHRTQEPTMNADRDSLEARARRRVARKIGFYIHAFVFVVVNLGLYALNQATGGPAWHHWPLMGWGLGLAIHGVVTFLSLQEGLRRRMVDQEIEALRRSEGR
jgi:hypothetical protein